MRKMSVPELPDLSRLPDLPHRKKESPHLWRWIFLIGVALAAIAWKTQTAVAPSAQRAKKAVDETVSGLKSAVETKIGDNRAESATSVETNSSSDPRAEVAESTQEESNAPSDSDAAEGEDAASDSNETPEEVKAEQEGSSPDAEDALSGAPTIQAGEDADGVFRPTRAETDAFGVVLTDTAPAGLEADTKWIKGDGAGCPEAFPVKGNSSSRIYHLPGEPSYEKTVPEFCFASEDDAKAAGYRPRAR